MINLTAVIENDEAIRKLKELQNAAKTTTSSIVSDADRSEMAFRKLGAALGSIGFTLTFKEIASNMAMIRGQFQQLEIAFNTMLGSKEKADKLMADTVRLAATTPFDLQGVAGGVKQLLAYGSETEDVIEEMKMLGNIAAGLSIPIGDLVYLYGTTRTQGRLFTMDLRQFMSRGIPLADELAKQFNVSKNKVSELVTEGKVGFDNMRQALVALTSEGGMFHNLMEEQSKSITGQLSNLEDSVQQMWNELGRSQEGLISTAISGVSYLVENYEKVGKILMDIAVAYGSYKAAMLATIAVQKIEKAITEQMIVEKALLAQANHAVSASALRHVAAQKVLLRTIASLKASMSGLTAALGNPYVVAGLAVANFGFAIYKTITAKNAEELAQERVNKKLDEYNEKQEEVRSAADSALSLMKDENATSIEKVRALDKLVKAYPELLDKYDIEKIKLMDVIALKKELNGIDSQRSKEQIQTEINNIDKEIAKNISDIEWAKDHEGLEGQQDAVDYLERRNEILSEQKRIFVGQLNEITRVEQEAAFDALPKADKLKALNEKLTEAKANLKSLQDGGGKTFETFYGPDYGKLKNEGAIHNAEKAVSDLESRIEAIKNSDDAKDVEQSKKEREKIERERKRAQEEANKAELAQMTAQTEDKVAILEAEKKAEVKAIEDRIKATTDAETIAALERKKTATINAYDANIERERKNYEKEAKKAVYDAKREGIDDELELLKMEKEWVLQELQDQIDKTTDLRTKAALEQKKTATEQLYNAKENAYFKKILEDTATYEEKRNKLIEDYQKKRKLLIEKGEMDNVVVLDKQLEEALWDLDFKESDNFKKIFRDASRLSRTELEKTLKLAEEAMSKITDPEQVKILSDKIKEIRNELETSLTKGFEIGVSAVANAFERLKLAKDAYKLVEGKGGDAEEEALANLEDAKKNLTLSIIGSSVDVVVKGLSKAADLMRQLADASGDVKIKEMADQLAAVSESLGNILQGFAQGGLVGGIASVVTTLINGITEVFIGLEIAEANLASFYNDFDKRLSLMYYRINDRDYDTIFGTNVALKAAEAYEKAKYALINYNSYADKTYRGRGGAAGSEPDLEVIYEWQHMMAKYKDINAAFSEFVVNTTHRSGVAKLFGAKDEYLKLADYAPEIFNADGSLNVDAAKEFLEIDQNLTEEQRKQLQYAIDLNDAYQNAKDVLENIATDIMGNMATSMSDAIFDAVDNGANAWAAFEATAAEAIKNIGKMMLESWIVEEYLSKYQGDFIDALGRGDKDAMAAIIGDMAASFQEMYSSGQDLVNQWYDAAKAEGIDLSSLEDGGQSATSRGFNAMSQDTGDELNGRFTDIQGKVTVISDMLSQMGSLSSLSYNEVVNIRDIMLQLNGNVDQIKVYTKVLPEMLTSMNSMNRKLENL